MLLAMASISKLSNALFSMPNELTVAAANFNLDFSLMKVEAPKEFHGLRDALSSHRRSEAEEGQPHITARRLGSLFESILPPIPNLIQAYGERVSQISHSMTATQKSPNFGIFTAHAGLDGTSIWAAATSGQSAFAVHLLACMLARMWKSHEATSLWVELVEQRKQEIKQGYQTTNTAETASIMAAQQIFYRQQLASWDSSARAWLQTADSDRKNQQTQLMLIINNVQIPVSTRKDAYESIMEAWKMGMCAMERLVQGLPQLVQNGAVLLAISAWHMYPNMEVLSDQAIEINQHDELMNGALLTIPTHSLNSSDDGIFWSLPLARMCYYSPPIEASRRLASDTSRVSMEDFWIVVLGCVLSQWGSVSKDIPICCSFIIEVYDIVGHPAANTWLGFLADATRRYTTAKGMYRRQCEKLLKLGMRWCKSFLNAPDCNPPPVFGLNSFEVLFSMIPNFEQKSSILEKFVQIHVPVDPKSGHISGPPASIKEISEILPLVEQQLLVDYLCTWWPRDNMANSHQQEISMRALVFATKVYEFLDGAMVSIEIIKKPLYEASWARTAYMMVDNTNISPYPLQPPNDFSRNLSTDKLIRRKSSFENEGSLERRKIENLTKDEPDDQREGEQVPEVGGHNAHVIRRDRESFSAASFACIVALESGECDIDLKSLRGVMALSMGDSIFVLSALISDPSKESEGHIIRRVFGNLGRPEIAFLVPPSKPRLKNYDPKSWHLIDHLPFDGKFESKFDGTSLHLSFTDFEMPVDVGSRGLRDTLVILLESLVSINDRGKHLGDIDVLSLFRSRSLTIKAECTHPSQRDGDSDQEPMSSKHEDLISIDSWDEFFDFPETTVIVRANGNWQARLAIASASIIQGKRTLILPEQPCLQCLEESCGGGSYDVIVA